MPSRPPNVLFIVADDHQQDALGCHGHPDVRTPTLDALARSGTDFARAYFMGSLIAPVCSPSRACLLTGRQIIAADRQPGIVEGATAQTTIATDRPLLPELFRSAGYETFITGKWHNDAAALQRCFGGGRRIFFGGMSDHRHVPLHDYDLAGGYNAPPHFESGFSTELFCDAAIDFIRPRHGRPPFFLYLALTSPHDPRTPPEPYASSYDPARLQLPRNFLPEHPFNNGELEIRDEKLAPKPLARAVVQRHLADYYGMISHQDAQLGRVLAALDAAGLRDDTLIVYVSDHGLALGRHGLLGKQNLYEHSVRVPMLLSGPGVPAGVVAKDMVLSLDLYATLAPLAGLAVPAGLESRRLIETGTLTRGRETVFALYKDCQRMTSDGRWKLIRYHVNGAIRLQLFDLLDDPDELHDLSARPEHRDTIERLSRTLAAWQAGIGDRWMPDGSGAMPAAVHA